MNTHPTHTELEQRTFSGLDKTFDQSHKDQLQLFANGNFEKVYKTLSRQKKKERKLFLNKNEEMHVSLCLLGLKG